MENWPLFSLISTMYCRTEFSFMYGWGWIFSLRWAFSSLLNFLPTSILKWVYVFRWIFYQFPTPKIFHSNMILGPKIKRSSRESCAGRVSLQPTIRILRPQARWGWLLGSCYWKAFHYICILLPHFGLVATYKKGSFIKWSKPFIYLIISLLPLEEMCLLGPLPKADVTQLSLHRVAHQVVLDHWQHKERMFAKKHASSSQLSLEPSIHQCSLLLL